MCSILRHYHKSVINLKLHLELYLIWNTLYDKIMLKKVFLQKLYVLEVQIVQNNEKQIIMSDEFFIPFGGKLYKENRWIKLANIMLGGFWG